MKKEGFVMKYAITAATGRFGQAAFNQLKQLVPIEDIVIVARNKEKAQAMFGNVTVRQADYDNVDALKQAFNGVNRVLFISSQPGGQVPRLTQHLNVVEALSANQVQLTVYTSFPKAETAISALAHDHRETEKALTQSGLNAVFARNNWYLENEQGFLSSGATNQVATFWASGRAGWALEREYAEAAAKLLVAETHKSIYEFAGPINDYQALGSALIAATGKKIDILAQTRTEYIEALERTGLNHDMASLFASFQAPIEEGSLDYGTTDLIDVLRHNLVPLPEAINDILKA